MNNIISSVSYLEFVNKISSLINELLYSPNNGYILLKSKNAVEGYESFLKKYDSETDKLVKEYDIPNAHDFIKQKRKTLLIAIEKHFSSEAQVWIDEVFNDLIDNILFDLSIDKQNSQKYFEDILKAIDWFCEIKTLENEDKVALVDKYSSEFKKVLQANNLDYIPKANPQKSDSEEFVRLWNMILDDEEEFLKNDFEKSFQKLSQKDYSYFLNLKAKLLTDKRIAIIDEIFLIKTSLEILNLKNSNEVYDFICQLNSDFELSFKQNKTISEEEKIKLIKRRISLFKDKNLKSKEYFKKLITSSLNA